MSNTSIPQRATLPHHPLLSILGLDSLVGARETLDFCADHLQLLADLFGDDNEKYTVLDNQSSRMAMFRQLMGMVAVIEAVSGALALKADVDRVDAEAGTP